MKTSTQVRFELSSNKARLKVLEARHSNLNQIDMLSAEGSQIRKDINQVKGIIKALNWVDDDKIHDIEV